VGQLRGVLRACERMDIGGVEWKTMGVGLEFLFSILYCLFVLGALKDVWVRVIAF